MNFFDKLALTGRRYEKERLPRTNGYSYTLADLLERFSRNTILELTPIVKGDTRATMRPDQVRKLKVSLLDGISAIHSHNDDWYEVYRTAPQGDLTRVRIVAYSRKNEKIGEVRMMVSERMPIYYFGEDPIFETIGGK